MQTGEVFVFSETLFNFGNAYSTDSGKFTAPVKGLYIFSVFVCTARDMYLHFAIKQGSTDLIKGTQHENTNMDCSSATVAASLDVGEKVWVQSTSASSSQKEFHQDSYRKNVFSGVLVHAM